MSMMQYMELETFLVKTFVNMLNILMGKTNEIQN